MTISSSAMIIVGLGSSPGSSATWRAGPEGSSPQPPKRESSSSGPRRHQGMARLRHRIPDAGDGSIRKQDSSSASPREEREDCGRRQPSRGVVYFALCSCPSTSSAPGPHRARRSGIAVAQDARETQRLLPVNPRPHTHVDTGALFGALLSRSCRRRVGGHRPDLAVHGKHHPCSIRNERPPVFLTLRVVWCRSHSPPWYSRCAPSKRCTTWCRTLTPLVAGGRAGAVAGESSEESENTGRDPIRGVGLVAWLIAAFIAADAAVPRRSSVSRSPS